MWRSGLVLMLLLGVGCSKEEPAKSDEPTRSEQAATPEKPAAEPSDGPSEPQTPATTAPSKPSAAPETAPTGSGSDLVLETGVGRVVVTLDARAPKTVAHVRRYVSEGHYDGLTFHHVLANGFAQVGAWGTDGKRRAPKHAPIALETHPDLGVRNGAVALARSVAPNTGSAELLFFVGDHPDLDGTYAVFGRVTDGLDVVQTIANTETERRGRYRQPTTPITLSRATLR